MTMICEFFQVLK